MIEKIMKRCYMCGRKSVFKDIDEGITQCTLCGQNFIKMTHATHLFDDTKKYM